MFRVVRLDEIVRNLMGKGEEPGATTLEGSGARCESDTDQEMKAFLRSPCSTALSSAQEYYSVPRARNGLVRLTPSFVVP